MKNEIYTIKDGKVYEYGKEMSLDWIASALNMQSGLVNDQSEVIKQLHQDKIELHVMVGDMIAIASKENDK